jgi:hypothetical protein
MSVTRAWPEDAGFPNSDNAPYLNLPRNGSFPPKAATSYGHLKSLVV